MEQEQSVRRGSKVVVYMHFVWTVKFRISRLTPVYERAVHHALRAKAIELGCGVIAAGGMPDHVHMLVRMPGKLSPSLFAQRVKLASGAVFNSMRPEHTDRFHWQDGYGCFSLWQSQCDKVAAYVNEQKERHDSNRLWDELEQFEEVEAQPFSEE